MVEGLIHTRMHGPVFHLYLLCVVVISISTIVFFSFFHLLCVSETNTEMLVVLGMF